MPGYTDTLPSFEVGCLVCEIEGSFACFEDIAALQERLATAEEAVEAATEAAKSASQDQAQKAEQLSQLEGRLVQVEEVSPEPVQQLAASVDELRSKMASTPWTQDRGLFKRLVFGHAAVPWSLCVVVTCAT